jgi:hypothetical protein
MEAIGESLMSLVAPLVSGVWPPLPAQGPPGQQLHVAQSTL